MWISDNDINDIVQTLCLYMVLKDELLQLLKWDDTTHTELYRSEI